MKLPKTVTEKKLAANRKNAARSPGPRTKRGKQTSRYNAVITGLFAEHVLIEIVDGQDSYDQFSRLVRQLYMEFQPEGPVEEYCVSEMAKNMWRIRRASLCEKSSVLNVVRWEKKNYPPSGSALASKATDELTVMKDALKEIRLSGTLSSETYSVVLPLIRGSSELVGKEQITSTEPCVDAQIFTSLETHAERLNSVVDILFNAGEQMQQDYLAANALPSEIVMNRIFRYEEAAQRKFDRAHDRLLESQQRRKENPRAD